MLGAPGRPKEAVWLVGFEFDACVKYAQVVGLQKIYRKLKKQEC